MPSIHLAIANIFFIPSQNSNIINFIYDFELTQLNGHIVTHLNCEI